MKGKLQRTMQNVCGKSSKELGDEICKSSEIFKQTSMELGKKVCKKSSKEAGKEVCKKTSKAPGNGV